MFGCTISVTARSRTLGIIASAYEEPAPAGWSLPLTPTDFTTTGTPASIALTDPGSIGANDIVIAVINIRQTNTLSDSSGTWTLIGGAPVTVGSGNNGSNLYVWWHRGEPSSWGFAVNGTTTSQVVGAVDVIRGAVTSGNPIVTSASATGTDGTIETPSLSGLTGDERCYTAVVWADSSTGGTGVPTSFGSMPSGWTNRAEPHKPGANSNQTALLLAYKDATSSSLASETYTLDATPNSWAAIAFALDLA